MPNQINCHQVGLHVSSVYACVSREPASRPPPHLGTRYKTHHPRHACCTSTLGGIHLPLCVMVLSTSSSVLSCSGNQGGALVICDVTIATYNLVPHCGGRGGLSIGNGFDINRKKSKIDCLLPLRVARMPSRLFIFLFCARRTASTANDNHQGHER